MQRCIPCQSAWLTKVRGYRGMQLVFVCWLRRYIRVQGMEKIRFIREMLAAGLQPLFSDLDVVWLRNPLPFVRQLQDPNVLVSSDSWAAVANATLDNCQQEMGSEQTVEGHDSFVGKMNVCLHSSLPK